MTHTDPVCEMVIEEEDAKWAEARQCEGRFA